MKSILGLNKIFVDNFKEIILKKIPLIDVRAPIEFAQGHLPGALNLPILDNEERKHIGITYKQQGRDKAIEIGYRLVSGENKKNKISSWIKKIKENPETLVYCFRGGLRSQIAQKWLEEEGIHVKIIDGGYKAFRQYLVTELVASLARVEFIIISGRTGSFKTMLLKDISRKHLPMIDLEELANHKGSAFGKKGAQPTQAQFENQLTVDLILAEEGISQDRKKKIFLEDESRLIGSCVLPEAVFAKMRASPVIWIEETLETRSHQVMQDYIISPMVSGIEGDHLFKNFAEALFAIKNKLGGLRYQEVQADLLKAKEQLIKENNPMGNLVWIQKLLSYYYDPMYEQSLKLRNPKILFSGNYQEVLSFITEI